MTKQEGLHAKLERGIANVEKKVEGAVARFEEKMDGPRWKKGDRVRSIVEYRKGMEGLVEKVTTDGIVVIIESTANGKPVEVECTFQHGELERVA